MKSLRLLDRRSGYSLASLGLLLGMVAPSVLPAFASADQLDGRSIAMSSATADEDNVSYTINFTPVTAAGSMVIDFCDGSPIPGQACGAPTGFSAAGAATTDGGTVTASTQQIKYVKSLSTSAKTIEFTGINNPSSVGTFYARILTYSDGAFGGYISATSIGTPQDQGGIALSTVDAIGVSAAVRESLTFCVSKAAPGLNCSGTDTPSLVLGHGTPAALDSTQPDTADAYSQVSTNALHGVVVNMKSDNRCGGLRRAEAAATVCDIAAAGSGDAIAAGTAKFGMKLDTEDVLSGGSGTTVAASDFGGSNYGMTYTGSVDTGVSSTYGAEVYHTTGPVNNINRKMTFAASASNTTPAGLYKASLSMVAVGTY